MRRHAESMQQAESGLEADADSVGERVPASSLTHRLPRRRIEDFCCHLHATAAHNLRKRRKSHRIKPGVVPVVYEELRRARVLASVCVNQGAGGVAHLDWVIKDG